jgi:zinc transporter ZupT
MSKRPFWQSLMAVLAGNAIYLGIERFLPASAQHQLFREDWGLALDFLICVVCYALVKWLFGGSH